MSEKTSIKKRVFTIAALLALSALLAFQGFADNIYTLRDNGNIESYNSAIDSLDDKDVSIDELIDKLSKVERLSDPESYVSIAAKYNVAYMMATHPEADIQKLRVARQLLVEALRLSPEDEDIRKNLELITAVLVQQVQQQLQEAGMSEEEAQETAAEQEIGDMPGTGEKHSRGGRNDSDY